MQLRPYQQAAFDGLFNWWDTRRGENPLIVIPTAGGKTVVFSTIIKTLLEKYPATRVLILAHTKELIDQAEKKLLSVWPGAPVGVMAAGLGRREIGQITIASRDTIKNVIDQVGVFDLVFIDEAHLIAPAQESGYMKIITALKSENEHLNVIGFTATPYRTGTGYIYGKDDKHIFSGVAYEAKIKPLMDQGYLCPIVSRPVSGKINTDGIKTTGGDYNRGELSQAAEKAELVSQSIDEWERVAVDRKSSVFFCVSIHHAEMVSQELEARGYPAPVISGKTPAGERENALAGFEAGEIPAIVNVGCLTTGWDAPRLDCVVLLRPTKSLGLFMQMVGRGLRLHPSKKNTLLLDFGGCLERFGPIDIATPPVKGEKAPRLKQCHGCGSLVGFLKKRCATVQSDGTTCPVVFDDTPPGTKTCPQCSEVVAGSTITCPGCGHLFATLEARASSRAVISGQASGPVYKTYSVESVEFHAAKSRKTEREYLRVCFRADLFNSFYKNIMIGFPGYAGEKAVRELRSIISPEFAPLLDSGPITPQRVSELAGTARDGGIPVVRPIESIRVDVEDKYKNIVEIVYKKDQPTVDQQPPLG